MTKLFDKKPHPAKAARILAGGMSATAFMSMIIVFSFNAHSAAALAPVDSAVPLGQAAAAPVVAPTQTVTSAVAAPKTKLVPQPVAKNSSTKKTTTPVTVKATAQTKATTPKATVTSKPVVVTPVTTPTQGTSGGSRKP